MMDNYEFCHDILRDIFICKIGQLRDTIGRMSGRAVKYSDSSGHPPSRFCTD